MNNYTAVAQPEGLFEPLEFRLRFLPRSFHEARGLPRSDNYPVYTDVPNARFKQYSVRTWTDNDEYISYEELREADRLIRERTGITENDDELVKLEKIIVFLRKALGEKAGGTPRPDFRWKNPFQLYQEMKSGTGHGWCTQNAQIFVFFANRTGLSTRLVQGARTQRNTFIFSVHTWLEAWIPQQGRWAWDGVRIRVYKDWEWSDIEGGNNTMVNARYEEVGGVVERQFITSAIYKWRRPPNVEDIRYDYRMLFKNRTFFAANLCRYFFKPPLASANFPVPRKMTYWIRHILLWGFVTSIVSMALVLVL